MKKNITKREIVTDLYRKNGTSIPQKHITLIVQQTIDAMGAALASDHSLELRGFGVLRVFRVKPRIGRNPNDPGVPIKIPARAVVRFRAGKLLKKRLAKLAA